MLQTYIPYSSKNTTSINEKIAMDSDDEQVVFLQPPVDCRIILSKIS